MIFSYYPGCSLNGSSKEYDRSTRAVCEKLGIELRELPDWICCGASSAHSLSADLNIGLPAHTLKIAEEIELDLAVPCAACYNRLKNAQHALKEQEGVQNRMKRLIDFDFRDNVKILNLIEVFRDRVGMDAIRSAVTKPLEGLKVACYYGCLLVRPKEVTGFDDPEHPAALDEMMAAVGAEPLSWSYSAECCGGSLSLSRDDVVKSLVGSIVGLAVEAGAHAIVTLCPLCMENLDMRQGDAGFPILYFTELFGLAFGIDASVNWMKNHLTDPTPVLASLDLIS